MAREILGPKAELAVILLVSPLKTPSTNTPFLTSRPLWLPAYDLHKVH